MKPEGSPGTAGDAPAATTDQAEDIVYRVNHQGRLTFVNDRWDAFAAANDAPEMLGRTVLGLRVMDFVEGTETKIIYDMLLKRAAAGESVTLPYRCDAPAERRRMSLTIAPHLPSEIEFRSRILELDPRESVPVLDRRSRRNPATLLTICSWCNRGRVDAVWAEIEEVVTMLHLFDDEVPQLTHGMCGDCERLVLADWVG